MLYWFRKYFIIFIRNRKSLGGRRIRAAWIELERFAREFYLFFICAQSQPHNMVTDYGVHKMWASLGKRVQNGQNSKTIYVRYARSPLLHSKKFKECHRFSIRNGKQQWSGGRYAETDTQCKHRNGEHLLADTTEYDENRSCRIFVSFCFVSFRLKYRYTVAEHRSN